MDAMNYFNMHPMHPVNYFYIVANSSGNGGPKHIEFRGSQSRNGFVTVSYCMKMLLDAATAHIPMKFRLQTISYQASGAIINTTEYTKQTNAIQTSQYAHTRSHFSLKKGRLLNYPCKTFNLTVIQGLHSHGKQHTIYVTTLNL
jgi:hypothetical protein